MATNEIKIKIPDEMAELFAQKVPRDDQPRFVVNALRRSLSELRTPEELDAMFEAACEVAPLDPNEENFDEWVAELRARHPDGRPES